MYQISFDTTATHSYAASTIFDFVVNGPLIPVGRTDKVRAQHLASFPAESARKVQMLGSFVIGLAFYDSAQALINFISLAALNPTTPDATIVPVDNLLVAAEDPHFLEIAAMNFGTPNQPAFVAGFASLNAKNSDAGAAHIVTLDVAGVIEIEPAHR